MRYYHHPESQSVVAAMAVQNTPGLEPIDRADFLVLRFEYAVAAHAFIGASHPSAHDDIEFELHTSREKLLEALRHPKANR